MMHHPAAVASQAPTMLPYPIFHPALGFRHMEYPVHPMLLPFHQQLAVNTQSGAFQYTVAGLPFQGHQQMLEEQAIRTAKNCFSPGQSGSSFTIDAILSKHGEKHEDISSPESSPVSRKISNSHRRHQRLKEISHPYVTNAQTLQSEERNDALQPFTSFSPSEKRDKKSLCAEWKSGRTKRVRTIFTPEQLERLEVEFERQQYMVGTERYYLATELNLTEAQVKVWFQNRRIKWRKQTLEKQHAKLATSDLYHVAESDSGADSDNETDRTRHNVLDTTYQNNIDDRGNSFIADRS